MKKILFFLILFPFCAFAQKGFEITGNVTGYPDGTSVSFLNQQTGVPEKQTTFKDGKFSIKGNVAEPSFIILVFADQAPAIPLFIGNEKISISGSKENLDHLSIKGSKNQDDWTEFSTELKPYEKIFMPDSTKDAASVAAVHRISSEFVKKHPDSYVSPIAIIRIVQSSDDITAADNLFKTLSKDVKNSSVGKYLDEQLALAKINRIGTQIPEFSQTDTSGKQVSVSSFKGKYVLIDFWASWCRPCREENPNVVAAYKKYHDKNFTVLGVSLDQAKGAWLNAIHSDHLTWTHVSDLKGWGNAVAGMFKITSIPQNILIDPSGKIIAKNLRGQDLNDKLKTIFR